jgi:hypothetical protein
MSEINQFIDRHALSMALILLAFVFVLYLNWKSIRHRWLDFKTAYRLNRLGQKQVADFQCPDGLGHYFAIDHLILRRDGITLLIYKRFPGRIFCADNIDDWTQMFNRKSVRFKNPLYDLDIQIKAVSACIPGVPVNGYLFFDHRTEFPKGHPQRVVHLGNIPEQLIRNKKDQLAESVVSAWEKLLAAAKG